MDAGVHVKAFCTDVPHFNTGGAHIVAEAAVNVGGNDGTNAPVSEQADSKLSEFPTAVIYHPNIVYLVLMSYRSLECVKFGTKIP